MRRVILLLAIAVMSTGELVGQTREKRETEMHTNMNTMYFGPPIAAQFPSSAFKSANEVYLSQLEPYDAVHAQRPLNCPACLPGY